MSELRPGQTSAVTGFADEVATDQVSLTHPEEHVGFHGKPVVVPSITRCDAGAVEAASMQQQQQLTQEGHDATAGNLHASAATAGTGTASTARQILTSTLALPPVVAATPLRVAAAEVAAGMSNVLELSPPHPVSRSQQPATSTTIPSAPAVSLAPAIIPWASSSRSSGGSVRRQGLIQLLDPLQQRDHTASPTPTAAAADLNPSSTVGHLIRHPPGFPVTSSNPLQHLMELQQGDDVSPRLPSSAVQQHLQQQARLQQQHQQYPEESYPPRPHAPEPPSPPAEAGVAPQWPLQPFDHHQLHQQPIHPVSHHTPHFNHPTTLADRDAARIITALERYRHDIHVLSNCLTCVSAPRSVVLLPCKHLALCEDCAIKMQAASQARVQGSGTEGSWVDFSAEGPQPAQAAAVVRWNVCHICGVGVEQYIAGVQVPASSRDKMASGQLQAGKVAAF